MYMVEILAIQHANIVTWCVMIETKSISVAGPYNRNLYILFIVFTVYHVTCKFNPNWWVLSRIIINMYYTTGLILINLIELYIKMTIIITFNVSWNFDNVPYRHANQVLFVNQYCLRIIKQNEPEKYNKLRLDKH